MRWPQDSAIIRRDQHLARTRQVTVWIIGAATAAVIALATAFGFALPGHALLSGLGSGGTGSASGSGGSGSGSSGGSGGQIAPPQQAPAGGNQQPVVTSGGS